MSIPMLVGLTAVVLLVGLAARLLAAWLKARGDRVITCPENSRPAGVKVDAGHAAWTSFAAKPDFVLSDCTRWPEMGGCGRQCLAQIEAAPEECLVRNVLTHWYEGQSCAMCGNAIGSIHGAEFKPGLVTSKGAVLAWVQLLPETLHTTLSESRPVCCMCLQATQFAHEHPELITERTRQQ